MSRARQVHAAFLHLWFPGRPSEHNLWAGYDRTLRHGWTGVALAHHRPDVLDRPAGTVLNLDGRFVTDIEGFHYAMGTHADQRVGAVCGRSL